MNDSEKRELFLMHFAATFCAHNPAKPPQEAVELATRAWEAIVAERPAPKPAPTLPAEKQADPGIQRIAGLAEKLRDGLRSGAVSPGDADNPSGPVAEFQTAAGIKADGIVGPVTRRAAEDHGVQM